jgi:hypothetical protein
VHEHDGKADGDWLTAGSRGTRGAHSQNGSMRVSEDDWTIAAVSLRRATNDAMVGAKMRMHRGAAQLRR